MHVDASTPAEAAYAAASPYEQLTSRLEQRCAEGFRAIYRAMLGAASGISAMENTAQINRQQLDLQQLLGAARPSRLQRARRGLSRSLVTHLHRRFWAV